MELTKEQQVAKDYKAEVDSLKQQLASK